MTLLNASRSLARVIAKNDDGVESDRVAKVRPLPRPSPGSCPNLGGRFCSTGTLPMLLSAPGEFGGSTRRWNREDHA